MNNDMPTFCPQYCSRTITSGTKVPIEGLNEYIMSPITSNSHEPTLLFFSPIAIIE